MHGGVLKLKLRKIDFADDVAVSVTVNYSNTLADPYSMKSTS